MVQLGELRRQGTDRTAIAFYVRPVVGQDVDEGPDGVGWVVAGSLLPALQHRPGVFDPAFDYRGENLVLGAEVVVEISARDLHRVRDIGEGGVVEAVLIEQHVRRLDDFSSRVSHCSVLQILIIRIYVLIGR